MPFDAVLLVAFGGPQGPSDIRPFLDNVLRGRRVSPERVEEVVRHYERFGGVSPITERTLAQAEGLRTRLAQSGHPLPVYVGMRNWHPYLADTLTAMADAGKRRAVGVVMSAFHSYSSCQQYRENVEAARTELRRVRPGHDVRVTYVGSWFDHPGFIEAQARQVAEAIERLPEDLRAGTRVVFTAHSIPVSMAERSLYREQLSRASALVAARVRREWTLVYQSRSGRPGDPWLEPDVCDYLRQEAARGVRAVVLCPIGFLCDHIEVLYDLDDEAAAVCRQLGVAMQRAGTVDADPIFLDALHDVVLRTITRYGAGALPIVAPPTTSPTDSKETRPAVAGS